MSAPVPSSAQGSLTASFKYAIDGVLRTLCTQRNMKIHWVSGTAVMLVGMALDLDISARASLLFCVFIVLCMEVLNTALEAFVDLHVKEYARHAMVAKDAAAAAVLVLAVCSVIVFADILFHRWSMVIESVPSVRRTLLLGIPILIMQGIVLTGARRRITVTVLGTLSLGCLAWLAIYAQDAIFSFCGLLFVMTPPIARLRQESLLR